jgi:hypothetical protein
VVEERGGSGAGVVRAVANGGRGTATAPGGGLALAVVAAAGRCRS